MNKTIININDNTEDMKVREYTKMLIANKGKRFRAIFTKKNGDTRTMLFTPRNNWNAMNGIDTITASGLKMLKTKCARNMATVTEILTNGLFQPRTINLTAITEMKLA